ncbi:hypothetical protein [Streptomyces sp. SID3343]|uniref:hypothetical protein n=1 Tax=Streptomyces sp. SID3343 TaxID=2690260 RepID=UPI0013696ECB|nr:hypothetical protein [Streptomyces sp. SID3343]MYW01225.1 hypothetical protein [Streptomyces sp. SID3343]
MKASMRAQAMPVAVVLLTILGGASAPAHAADSALKCSAKTICLWYQEYGEGDLYQWKGGYVDLPAKFRDHVWSFRANRSGAFIDWSGGKKTCRSVSPGDEWNVYREDFGSRIDAVADKC